MLDLHRSTSAELPPSGVAGNAMVPAHLQQKGGPVKAIGSAAGAQKTMAQFGTGVKTNRLGRLAQQESERISMVLGGNLDFYVA